MYHRSPGIQEICRNCKSEVPPGALQCAHCGRVFDRTATMMRRPSTQFPTLHTRFNNSHFPTIATPINNRSENDLMPRHDPNQVAMPTKPNIKKKKKRRAKKEIESSSDEEEEVITMRKTVRKNKHIEKNTDTPAHEPTSSPVPELTSSSVDKHTPETTQVQMPESIPMPAHEPESDHVANEKRDTTHQRKSKSDKHKERRRNENKKSKQRFEIIDKPKNVYSDDEEKNNDDKTAVYQLYRKH